MWSFGGKGSASRRSCSAVLACRVKPRQVLEVELVRLQDKNRMMLEVEVDPLHAALRQADICNDTLVQFQATYQSRVRASEQALEEAAAREPATTIPKELCS